MKKMLLSFIIVLPLMLYSTVIPGGDVSGIWEVAGNPYYIDGDIFLQADAELEIEAGVEIIFNDFYKFVIYGQLTAIGAPENMISFSVLDVNTGWHGLRFIDGNQSTLPGNILSYCSFTNGFAIGETEEDKFGGAVYCYNSANLTIDNSNFTNNYAEWDGGAIYLEEGSDVTISGSTFELNNCGFYGGSIISYSSAPVISNCIFDQNNASFFGAGISFWEESSIEIYNSSFLNNSGGACTGIYGVSSNAIMAGLLFYNNTTITGSGAAIGLTTCSTEASNITAVDNVSPMSGGAFWLNGGTLALDNSILWNNLPEDIYVLSGTATASYSCISDGFSGTMVIDDDPLFLDYGGQDFHLQEDSPGLDTGDATVVGFTLPEFDLDGNERIVDGDEDGTATIDMGAYEYFIPGPETGFIAGTITNTDGDLLEGAQIEIGTYTAYSDSEGFYQLELEVGDYTVNCSLEGYISAEPVEVTVIANETTTVNFMLEPEVSSDDPLNQAFVDNGNYPNPFNPVTFISFQLPEKGFVKLEIFNARGQLVRSLVNSRLSAGVHQVRWDGKDDHGKEVNSGIYFYRISTAASSSLNKMILLK